MSLPYPSLRQGLIGAWCPSLGDSGLVLQDRSPWKRNAVLPTSLVTAYGGRICLRPTGTSAVQTSFNVLGLADFTVSAWAWADSYSGYARIVDSNYLTNFWIGQGRSSGTFGGGIQQTSVPYGVFATGRFNTWLCIVMTRQGSAQTVRVFDGTTVSTATGTTPAVFQSQPLFIASAVNGLGQWTGGIDDVRVYNRALNESECRLLSTRPGIGLRPAFPNHDDDSDLQNYPIAATTNRLYANQGGVWIPAIERANVAGAWNNGDVIPNVGGTWATASTDADAAAYLAAVEAADGQSLEPTTRAAIVDFIVGCKADGIWQSIAASCILGGARTLAGALVPLKGPAPTNFNFVSADYNRKTGLAGNGSTKYLNSNFTQTVAYQNNIHVASFTSTSPNNTLLGTVSVGAGAVHLYGGINFRCQDNAGTSWPSVYTSAGRLYGLSRSDSSGFNYSLSGAVGRPAVASNGLDSTNPIYLFAVMNFGSMALFSSSRQFFYSTGQAIDLGALGVRVEQLYKSIAAAF